MKKIDLRPQVKEFKKGVKKTIQTAATGATIFTFSAITLAHTFSIEIVSVTNSIAMPKIVDVSINSIDPSTGDFTAEGVSVDNPNEVWEVAGTLVNGKVEIELEDINATKRIIASGKVSEDGTVSGRAADEDGELFEWEATDALVAKANS